VEGKRAFFLTLSVGLRFEHRARLSTGGIVGVSIGGAVLLVALGLIAWFMWRRKSRDGDSDDDSKPQPFAYQPVADSDGPLPPPGRFEKTARRLTITPTASVPHSPPTSPPITPGVTSIWQSTSHGKSYGKSQSPPPHSPADPRFSIATGNVRPAVPFIYSLSYSPCSHNTSRFHTHKTASIVRTWYPLPSALSRLLEVSSWRPRDRYLFLEN